MTEQVELSTGAVLVLDTAGSACQAGLYRDGICKAMRSPEMKFGQAEWLVPLVTEVMAEADFALADLTAVVATVGPGSFTGLRVGLAAAQGFGIAADCPVVGVSSLASWALSTLIETPDLTGILRVALDSRRGDAFVQDFDAKGLAASEPCILPVDQANNCEQCIGDLVGNQSAPTLAGIFAAAQMSCHQILPQPLYLRPADAVPSVNRV